MGTRVSGKNFLYIKILNLIFVIVIISVLRRAFDTLDPKKKGSINVDDLGTILDILGQHQNDQALKDLVASVDKEGIFFLNTIKIFRKFLKNLKLK